MSSVRVPIAPGATLPPDLVVGRDELVRRYSRTLQDSSLMLVAPRRVGKSSICRKMAAQVTEKVEFLYRDLQGNRTVDQFMACLYEDTQQILSRLTKTKVGAVEFIRGLTGTVQYDGLKVTIANQWQKFLEILLDDVEKWGSQNDRLVVLAWDEFTWFLLSLVQEGSARDAMVLLDRLRACRQSGKHLHLRFVFTGSIGMEEVLDQLKRTGYGNDPFNDVRREVVPLMDPASAAELARALLPLDQVGLSPVLAQVCEGHPYFLHHVAFELREAGVWTEAAAQAALDRLLESETDPLELRQYLDRLCSYYPEDRRQILALLDRVAQGACTVDDLVRELGMDREVVLTLTDHLRRDLYLQRSAQKFQFRNRFLLRFWCIERGLSLRAT